MASAGRVGACPKRKEIKVLTLSQGGIFRKDAPSNHHAGSGPHLYLRSLPCVSTPDSIDSTAASICTPGPCICASSMTLAKSSTTRTRTLKMCLVHLRAETAKPKIAGAVSANEVNSDPRAMREEEKNRDCSNKSAVDPCRLVRQVKQFAG